MHDRSPLGPADVTDADLARMVAVLLGHPTVEVLDSRAEEFPYDIPAITTAGRYWVSGNAATPTGTEPFRMFVKHVQAWHRHPFFAFVPDEHKESAAASVPWRTEPLAYRSDLGDRLPEGLHMPRALAVVDLPDDDAAAVWLTEVAHPPVTWDTARYERAAYLLGRMAASERVAPLADVGFFGTGVVDHYVRGRIAIQVAPILLGDEVWQHPVIRATFGPELRERIRSAARRVDELGAELALLPVVTGHGDASPNNLLPGPTGEEFVLIDYGFWGPKPLGFDLGQLLVGEVQLGRRSPDLLAETDEAIVAAYHGGLADEGMTVPVEVVRRAHALHLLLFSGLSALPFEELEQPPSVLGPLATSRAALARFSLDLVDATS